MKLLIIALFGLLTPEYALAQCGPMAEEQLEQELTRASDALNTDNLIEHGAAVRQIKTALPCLDGRLPTEPWSEFLVGLAIVEYTLGRDWEPYLNRVWRNTLQMALSK